MSEHFQCKRVSEQVAERLREELAAGLFVDRIPGEWTLAERYGVSRRSIREALRLLEGEGRLAAHRGRRRTITAVPPPTRRAGPSAGIIAFLAPERPEMLGTQVLLQIEALRHRLENAGYRLELVLSRAHRAAKPDRILERIVPSRAADVWILHLSTPAMHHWFAARSVPCIVNGTADPACGLPFVDIDWLAVGRHAAGVLLGQGHRRVAVLEPEEHTVGLECLNTGLAEGLARAAPPASILHDGSPGGIRRALARGLAADPRPTALIVHAFRHLLTAVTALQHEGYRIPEALSVLCTDDDPLMERMVPPVAHYRRNAQRHGARLADLVLHGPGTGRRGNRVLLIPDYIAGASVSAPPAGT